MKRYPTILNLSIQKGFDFNKINDNIKETVINETYKAIEHGIKNNKKRAEIFEIIDTRAIINIDRSKWKNILNNIVIPYFSNKEDYETCINIQKNLITKL